MPKKIVQGKAMLQRETLNHTGHLEIVSFPKTDPLLLL